MEKSPIDSAREMQIKAEKMRKKGDDLKAAGQMIAHSAELYFIELCRKDKIAYDKSHAFDAVTELARRYRQQNLNKQFGLAWLLRMNADRASSIGLSGDQIKTYFKDVQRFIHFCRDKLKDGK